MWDLQFVSDKNGLKTLKILLDNGLDVQSAEILIDHIFTDMDMCDGSEVDDKRFLRHTIWSIKMIMLTASYPHIIDNNEYIQRCIELSKNDKTKLCDFRVWNKHEYNIDISTCTNVPYGLQDATLTIKDKKTSEDVWSFLL